MNDLIISRFREIIQPQQNISLFAQSTQRSPLDLKIIAIVAFLFILLGATAIYCWRKIQTSVPSQLENEERIEESQVAQRSPAVKLRKEEVGLDIQDKEMEVLPIHQAKMDEEKANFEELIIETDFTQERAEKLIEGIDEIAPFGLTKEIPPILPVDADALFKELEKQTEKVPTLPFDVNFCRFPDVLCPVATRVEIPGAPHGAYLHANHVTLEGLSFIASQYPLPNQKPLFWQIAQEACLIIDLTNDADLKKGLDPYYPALGQALTFNDNVIKCGFKQAQQNSFSIYHYQIEINSGASQAADALNVPRLHVEAWDDHLGLTEDQIDQIILIIELYQKDSSKAILIHCRAGIGRSGTLIVARVLQELINRQEVTPANFKETLCRLILEGRKQRGDGFVQTPKQLLALWKWGWRAVHRGPLTINVSRPLSPL